MANAITSKKTSISGNKSFHSFDTNAKNHTITGSSSGDVLTLSSMDNRWSWNPENVNLSIDLGAGSTDTVAFSGDCKPVTLTANTASDGPEFFSEGGYFSNNSAEIASLDVDYTNVEKFILSDRNDRVNLAGARKSVAVDAGAGEDELWGSDLGEVLIGGAGDDLIVGEGGNDQLWGGTGTDTFYFFAASGSDSIMDFETGDRIVIDGYNPNQISVAEDSSVDGLRIDFGSETIFLDGVGRDRTWNITDEGGYSQLTINSQGSSGDTVICTYMHARGYISDAVFQWDHVYVKRLGAEVLAGYHVWAIPLVENVLKRSEIATLLVRPMACAWAQEMAHRCDPGSHPTGAVLGKVLLGLGVPLCRAIGRLVLRATPSRSGMASA